MREIVSANPSHRSPSKAHQSGIKQEEKKTQRTPTITDIQPGSFLDLNAAEPQRVVQL